MLVLKLTNPAGETRYVTGASLLVDGGMTAGYHQREMGPLSEPGP